MKLGILAYRQYPYISANTAIAYAVGKEIANKKQVDIVYIGLKQNDTQNSVSEYQGNKVFFFNEVLKSSKHGICDKILCRLSNRYRLKEYFLTLKEIVKREQIDALLCVIAPIDDAYITYFANLNIPIYLYQLDPFYDSMDIENKKLKRDFIKMLKRFKNLFTTDLLYIKYQNDYEIKKYIDKITVLQFPKLAKPNIDESVIENNGKIRLLYAGTLYKDIRSPNILIRLKESLSDDCEIVFCGSCTDERENIHLQEKGIICKGYCSQDDLQHEMKKADIFINIGNLVKNQLGSKIFDYISYGKPILNIVQFDNCPTISVLERYEYKYTISVRDLNAQKAIQNMIMFIREMSGKKMDWYNIAKRYHEYSPEYVSDKIIEIISKHKEG